LIWEIRGSINIGYAFEFPRRRLVGYSVNRGNFKQPQPLTTPSFLVMVKVTHAAEEKRRRGCILIAAHPHRLFYLEVGELSPLYEEGHTLSF
jgi:hypothetical protein